MNILSLYAPNRAWALRSGGKELLRFFDAAITVFFGSNQNSFSGRVLEELFTTMGNPQAALLRITRLLSPRCRIRICLPKWAFNLSNCVMICLQPRIITVEEKAIKRLAVAFKSSSRLTGSRFNGKSKFELIFGYFSCFQKLLQRSLWSVDWRNIVVISIASHCTKRRNFLPHLGSTCFVGSRTHCRKSAAFFRRLSCFHERKRVSFVVQWKVYFT